MKLCSSFGVSEHLEDSLASLQLSDVGVCDLQGLFWLHGESLGQHFPFTQWKH